MAIWYSNVQSDSMKIISWNIRGFKSLSTFRYDKSLVKHEKPSILCFQETKLKASEIDRIKKTNWPRSLSLSSDSVARSGGLLILWDTSKVICTLISNNNFCLIIHIRCIHSGCTFYLINVYGPQS